jgi:hypothetical protein
MLRDERPYRRLLEGQAAHLHHVAHLLHHRHYALLVDLARCLVSRGPKASQVPLLHKCVLSVPKHVPSLDRINVNTSRYSRLSYPYSLRTHVPLFLASCFATRFRVGLTSRGLLGCVGAHSKPRTRHAKRWQQIRRGAPAAHRGRTDGAISHVRVPGTQRTGRQRRASPGAAADTNPVS